MAGVLVSFLDPDPDGEGRVPLPFFGRMVPLFTVGRNGRVAIIGLAGRKRTTTDSVQKKKNDIRRVSTDAESLEEHQTEKLQKAGQNNIHM